MKKKNFLRSLIIIAIFTLLLLLFKVFYPRSYGVPALATRVDTTHWILPTGSDIAYTIIHADLNKSFILLFICMEGQAAILPDQILKHSHRLHKMVMMFISTTRLEAAIQTGLMT